MRWFVLNESSPSDLNLDRHLYSGRYFKGGKTTFKRRNQISVAEPNEEMPYLR